MSLQTDGASSTPDTHLAFSEEEREALVHAGTPVLYEPGDVVFEAGDEGRVMYVVVSGEVEISFPTGGAVKRLRAGGCFGELALLMPEHRRTGTARAVGPTELRAVDSGSFEELVSTRPRLTLQLLQGVSRYLLASEQALAAMLLKRNEELERALDYLRQTRRELENQEILARTDGLTGLFNRRCLDAELPRFIERAERTGQGLALIILDLDRFKEINDEHGHGAGDEALRHVSRMITASVRRSDLACRLGGDEFSVVLDDISPARARLRVLGLLGRLASTPMPGPGGAENRIVVASVGGTMHRSGDEARDLMERADRELYRAKRLGGMRASWMGEVVEATTA